MTRPFQILPDQASTIAPGVDHLFYFLCAISIVVSAGIVLLLFYLSIRYRKTTVERPPMRGQAINHEDTRRLEVLWIVVPVLVFLGIFFWGAKLYVTMNEPPEDALTVYVVGKRWMWKTQHVGGQREINELHVPLGQPVKLVMTSEDVIHSFYIPAFRVKQDVLPGRYSTMWFEATKLGEYHLFCAEYCGTKHSQMVGRIVVMEPSSFQTWLGGGKTGTMAQAGEKRFNDLGCATCHKETPGGRGPRLRGLFGSRVQLASGEPVLADESYLRESILDPRAKLVRGYEPIMPTYATQLGEEGVLELIAYIKSLEPSEAAPPAADAGTSDAGDEPLEDVDAGAEPVADDAGAAEPTGPTDADAGVPAAEPAATDAGTDAGGSP